MKRGYFTLFTGVVARLVEHVVQITEPRPHLVGLHDNDQK